MEYWNGPIPWSTVKDLKAVYLTTTEEFITEQGLENSSSKLIPRGTVIIATRMAVGKAVVFSMDVSINQDLKAIHLKPVVNSNFFLQWYLSKSETMSALATGSTVKGIRVDDLQLYPLKLPPLPEQKKIAAILTSVDTVIEKTQAQIDKLNDLKTGMMQELLTKGIGPDGKPHTEFKDSPVGRIPVGWECLPLSKVCELNRGKFSHRPRNDPEYYGGTYPFLQTGDIPKEEIYIEKYSQTLNEKGLTVSKIFPVDTLVITIAATIGEIGILKFESCFPDSLVGITPRKSKMDIKYLIYVLRYFNRQLIESAPQTAQKNINLDILRPFEIPVPPLSEQMYISSIVYSIEKSIVFRQKRKKHLLRIKKALMQDLLTGKVRVTPDPH